MSTTIDKSLKATQMRYIQYFDQSKLSSPTLRPGEYVYVDRQRNLKPAAKRMEGELQSKRLPKVVGPFRVTTVPSHKITICQPSILNVVPINPAPPASQMENALPVDYSIHYAHSDNVSPNSTPGAIRNKTHPATQNTARLHKKQKKVPICTFSIISSLTSTQKTASITCSIGTDIPQLTTQPNLPTTYQSILPSSTEHT